MNLTLKAKLGAFIAEKIQSGATIAVGTGSTVDALIAALGRRISLNGERFTVVPTSIETAAYCAEVGCTVVSPHAAPAKIAEGYDGADEVDEDLGLIKGLGGALLREKIIASVCESFTILVDESKLVSKLGERCPVPIEIIPEARTLVMNNLSKLGATSITLRDGRTGKHGPAITESGNLIIDARFNKIDSELSKNIKSLVGVVEHGIFLDLCHKVVIASQDGIISERQKKERNRAR